MQDVRRRRRVDEALVAFFQDRADGAARTRRARQTEVVLYAVEDLERDRTAVVDPGRCEDVLVARRAVVQRAHRSIAQVDDAQRDARVVLPGERIALMFDGVVAREIILNGKVGHPRFVEREKGDRVAVRRPRVRVRDVELFAVQPVGIAVQASRRTARRQPANAPAPRRDDLEIAVVHERDAVAGRRPLRVVGVAREHALAAAVRAGDVQRTAVQVRDAAGIRRPDELSDRARARPARDVARGEQDAILAGAHVVQVQHRGVLLARPRKLIDVPRSVGRPLEFRWRGPRNGRACDDPIDRQHRTTVRAARSGARSDERERADQTTEPKDHRPTSMDDSKPQQNPIVAMAQRLRARRDLGAAIDSATAGVAPGTASDAEANLRGLGDVLTTGAKRLNAILGARTGVTIVKLEKPLRIRLRFRDKRIALDLDERRQLVLVSGAGLDGEYQFVDGEVPSLLNLSHLSTEEGYRDPLTGSKLLKTIAEDAELPRPAHLDEAGPMRF